MKSFHKYLSLALSVLLTMNLTACGSSGGSGSSGGTGSSTTPSPVSSNSTVGDDWRKSGVVVDSGTIIHSGENSMYVLVTVEANSVAFYRDEPEQILVDRITFPVKVADAATYFDGICFDDVNDDGESDVSISFAPEQGEVNSLVWTWDPDERYVYREDLSSFAAPAVDMSQFIGLWKYTDEDLWLRIYEGESWEFLNDQEMATAFGSLREEDGGITLYFDDTGEDVMHLDLAVSGDLLDGDGGVLVPVESIPPREPYFTSCGLKLNAEIDKGTYLLKNGVSSYVNLGTNYSRGDCYWEVSKNYDLTHDGIREIQFDAICYVPSSSLGTFNQQFLITTHSELYDYYTGLWFNTDNDHTEKNHTDRIDNHYVKTLEWAGHSCEIEYSFSTEAEFFVADWYLVYTASYLVCMPEDYDGLLFVAEPVARTYEEHMKWSDPTLDYYLTEEDASCLFFDICGAG